MTVVELMLSELHSETAKAMLKMVLDAKKGAREALSSSELMAITKFLKDNHIDCSPKLGAPILELSQELTEEELIELNA